MEQFSEQVAAGLTHAERVVYLQAELERRRSAGEEEGTLAEWIRAAVVARDCERGGDSLGNLDCPLRSIFGMLPSNQEFDTEARARAYISALLLRRLRSGHTVEIQTRGESWEIGENEEWSMIPDTCGMLSLSDNLDEREEKRERFLEDASLYYYVSVRVKSADLEEEGA